MGKVGSSSVVDSLKNQGIGPVYHVHRMDPDHIRRLGDRAIGHHRTGLSVYRVIVKKEMPAKFITLTREPVGRNISAYFENLYVFEDNTVEINEGKIEQMVADFLARYVHVVPLTWFDEEINTISTAPEV